MGGGLLMLLHAATIVTARIFSDYRCRCGDKLIESHSRERRLQSGINLGNKFSLSLSLSLSLSKTHVIRLKKKVTLERERNAKLDLVRGTALSQKIRLKCHLNT